MANPKTQFTYTVADTTIAVETRPDLFSPKDLDKGSRLLLEAVAKIDFATALDWGCGWGALALWLSECRPGATVTALDSDIGAIKQITDNVARNRINNMLVIASPGYEEIPKKARYNLIVSHPPTHRGRIVVEDMIRQSREHLTKDGQLVIVVEARLKPWIKRCLEAEYAEMKILKKTNKHVVFAAHGVPVAASTDPADLS